MPVHFPSESGPPAETPHGRSNGRAPDSVRLGILSECSLKVRRLLREQDQAGALPVALSISRDAKPRCRRGLHRPGCGGSTPPSCRGLCRLPPGLQALQRCSGFLNRRARGSTVATHHFRIRGEIIIILRFERRVCRWESCRMRQFTGMWLNPNSRGSRLRIWQPWGCNSLHAHHFAATGFSGNSRPRRLKIAEPSGCKSRVADRRVVYRE
jgi:hypothetical protein